MTKFNGFFFWQIKTRDFRAIVGVNFHWFFVNNFFVKIYFFTKMLLSNLWKNTFLTELITYFLTGIRRSFFFRATFSQRNFPSSFVKIFLISFLKIQLGKKITSNFVVVLFSLYPFLPVFVFCQILDSKLGADLNVFTFCWTLGTQVLHSAYTCLSNARKFEIGRTLNQFYFY